MKKETPKPKSKLTLFIWLGGIIITVLVIFCVGYFLILPTLSKNSDINSKLELEKAKTAKIDQSLDLLKSLDKKKIASLSLFLDSFIPAEIDMLHFATLNEIVARDAGVQISTIQLTQSKLNKTAKPTQKSSPMVTITYKSNFESLLTLLNYWFLADQIVGVNDVVITGQSGGIVNYTISYAFPKTKAVDQATIEDSLNLSNKQIDKLQALQEKVKYIATPSAHPLGSKNPFR